MLTPDTLLRYRYRIQKLAGQSSQSTVYEATDEQLGVPVILKEWRSEDRATLDGLEQEARTRNWARHPVLPTIVDRFMEDGAYYLVMRLIPGPSLGEQVAREGRPLPLAEALQVADQLLDALEYLHSRTPPIFHRDIKPQNIKVDEQGEIVLVDVELPFPPTPESAPPSPYRPPEYGAGATGAGWSPPSDLYGLAATLYYLLTAKEPPSPQARLEAKAEVWPEPLVPVHLINRSLPAALGNLLMRAMSLEPADRLQSAVAFRAELKNIAALPKPSAAVERTPPKKIPPVAPSSPEMEPPAPVRSTPEPALSPLPTEEPERGTTPTRAEMEEERIELSDPEEEGQGQPEEAVQPAPSLGPLDAGLPDEEEQVMVEEPSSPGLEELDEAAGSQVAEDSSPRSTVSILQASSSGEGKWDLSRSCLWLGLGGGVLGLCLVCLVTGGLLLLILNLQEPTEQAGGIGQQTVATELPSSTEEDEPAGELLDSTPTRRPRPSPTRESASSGDVVSVFELEVGDCFDDPETEEIQELRVLPCEEPHDNEVFALINHPADEGEPFPPEEELQSFVDEQCRSAFEEYVGLAYDLSIFGFLPIQPTEESWQSGDREILCVLYDAQDLDKLQGSMKDSER